MTLNKEQKTFYDTVKSLDFGKLLLLGEGGTGKTFTIAKTLTELSQEGNRVCVTAPTHAAVETLRSKFDPALSTTIRFCTVASLLRQSGFKTKDGSTAFRRPNGGGLASYDIIAVDEVSMLSAGEQAIFLAAEGTQVVFTGDLAQLPVVMKKSADWSETETHRLVEQVRQSGSVHQLAQKCREGIYVPTEADADGDTVFLEGNLKEAMLSRMKRSSVPYYNYRYLTWKNEDVDAANDFFHRNLFGSEPFCKGENLMIRSNHKPFHNGQIVTVEEVIESNYDGRFKVTTYFVKLTDGEILRTLSREDQTKVAKRAEGVQAALKRAVAKKNFDEARALGIELEELTGGWIKWNYAYASTVHKSQGMTIPNVYVDIAGFYRAPSKKSLIYVGVSRASETLTFNQGKVRENGTGRHTMWVSHPGTGHRMLVKRAEGCPEGYIPVSKLNRVQG